MVATPLVALVPPHAPWAIGAVVVSLLLARRAYGERITLVDLDGRCPRCGTTIEVDSPSGLRDPHPLSCEGCNHEPSLRLSDAVPTRPPS